MNKKPLKKNEIIDLLKKIKPFNTESEIIDLFESEDRFLSRSVKSKINLPPFNNSAVDGYALHDDDVGKIIKYKISNRITAGEDREIICNKKETSRIFTGAKMPTNSTTVVMQENVKKKNNNIEIIKQPLLGENCRFAGEDIPKEYQVCEKGQKITSKNISLLAAIGKRSIEVKKKLLVGYFTSGNELLNPSENLSGAKINNSNQYALHALLNKKYLDSNYLGNLKDTKDEIKKLFMKHLYNYSVIITSGGASVGEEDYLINIIKENGELIFWKTAIKPGRPLAIGKIQNTFFICLPGNPVSVYLLYGMLIKSFLEYLCSSNMKMPPHYVATVNFSMRKKTERLEWLRVNIDKNCKHKILVNKYSKQGSGMISSIAFTDGIIEIPEDVSQINKGDKFSFFLFSDLLN